ncbi:hypothetical protein R2F61_08460 [Mollicutes bacterium LVI A0078]|nr:hypothetical protein RZE84_08235 [Mollicutes bacterium LVI A0075]WOO90741.1 hypothetical protein R2F61_08460 [Mollicutes bacterium LVI A0078]
MSDKRDIYFDIQLGGNDNYSDEMLDANKDLTTRVLTDEEIKLKEDEQLKPEIDLEINGKDYHISIDKVKN